MQFQYQFKEWSTVPEHFVFPKAKADIMAHMDWENNHKLTNLSSEWEILVSLILNKK